MQGWARVFVGGPLALGAVQSFDSGCIPLHFSQATCSINRFLYWSVLAAKNGEMLEGQKGHLSKFQEPSVPCLCTPLWTTTQHTNVRIDTALLKENTSHSTMNVRYISEHHLTWSFVALKAVARCPRHPSKAGVGVVARKDLLAGRGGSPISRLNGQRFQGAGASSAKRVLHRGRAHRDQRRLLEGAPDALSQASTADGLIGATRLSRSKKNTPGCSLKHRAKEGLQIEERVVGTVHGSMLETARKHGSSFHFFASCTIRSTVPVLKLAIDGTAKLSPNKHPT